MTTDPLLTRREFLGAAALGALGAHSLAAQTTTGPLLFLGTYTEDGQSHGIYPMRVDARLATLRPAGAPIAADNPSFLAVHPNGRFLFAANELTEFQGQPTGRVSAFALNRGAGTLRDLGARVSGGAAPCYVSVDRGGRFLLAANYVGGSVGVWPIGADGRLGEPTATVQHSGSGPNAERQKSPHAHCIITDPGNRFALAADLGIDQVISYRFDAKAGTLARAGALSMKPGAGPRHLAFAPGGTRLYVTTELDSTVATVRYTAATGAMELLQTVPATKQTGANAPADIHVHPSGRFVYSSNRGPNTISVFAVKKDGTLAAVEEVSTRGDWPRNFAIDPTGRFLFVANQRSRNIAGFRINQQTGRLTRGAAVDMPTPVCIRFV